MLYSCFQYSLPPLQPLRQEYRGQRSAAAIEAFVRELVADPVLAAHNEDELQGHLDVGCAALPL